MSTIKDVANRAGVSISTVSYALSGKRSISAEVRQKIHQAIEELDFTPSAQGRGLRDRKSRMIGIAYPIQPPMFEMIGAEFLGEAAAIINNANLGLSLFTQNVSPQQILNLFRNRTIDGIILMQVTRHDPRVEILRHSDFPFVCMGRCADTEGLTYVDYDAGEAVYLAIQHLYQLGHRTIGYLDLPQQERDVEIGYAMYAQKGLQQARVDFPICICQQETGSTFEDGRQTALSLLEENPQITAFVTLRGGIPIGVLRAVHGRGCSVPEDFSITGITTERDAEWSTPRLTSADIPLEEMGRISADLLLHKLQGTALAEQILLPARLIRRESTASPANPQDRLTKGK